MRTFDQIIDANMTVTDHLLRDAIHAVIVDAIHEAVDVDAIHEAMEQEREACAKVLEENAKACVKDSLMYKVLMSNAMAIRARGSEPCPECGGAGIILVPNTDVMPCPHCLSLNPTG